ncbi:MAG: ABC transporter ATP-binding protein [Candidatus Heimdallarchaeota archaeon]
MFISSERPSGYKWWLFTRIARRKAILLVVMVMTIAVVFVTMYLPVLIGEIIDEAIIAPQKTSAEKKKALISLVFVLLGLVVARVLIGYLVTIANDYLGWATEKDLREEFFDRIQSKPLTFHNRVQTGDMMALATNDMRFVNSMVSPGARLMSEVVLGIAFAAILAVSVLDWRLALLSVPFLLAYIWTGKGYGKKLAPIASTFQRKFANMAVQLQDSVYGAEVVRAFTGEDYEREKFEAAVVDFRDTWIIQQKLQAKYWPMLILYMAIGTSFVFGAYLVFQGELTIGQLLGFNGLLIAMIGPTERLYWSTNMLQGGLAGGARIYAAMIEGEKEETETLWHWPSELRGEIRFENVSFTHAKGLKPVLENINLTVEPGQTVAIVGPTGCGKTTLTQLLLRLYEPSEGKITIDGVDIREFHLEELRQNIGRIEQDIFLFPRSIKENISFGRPGATENEIEKAAELAQVEIFAKDLPKGYDTEVGERGTRLSGGQRQRIAIARAFLTDPKILILDDSTSAIDSETEARIVSAIEALLEGRTTLVITHRLHTIRNSDKAVVLKEGKIVAEGVHDELLQTSNDYRRVFGKHLDLPPIKAVFEPEQVPIHGEV